MSNLRISQLPVLTTLDPSDLLLIVDTPNSITKQMPLSLLDARYSLATGAVTLAGTQTLTNKTLGAGTSITAGTMTTAVAEVDPTDPTKKWSANLSGATTGTTVTFALSQTANRTLTFPDATDTLVGRSTTDTLTSKTLGAGTSITAGTMTTAVAEVDPTDPTKKWNAVLSGAATSTTVTFALSQTANRTLTFPDATDTLVGRSTTDTLTNKTLTAPVQNSYEDWTQVASQATPGTGLSRVYVKVDGNIYTKNSLGTETQQLQAALTAGQIFVGAAVTNLATAVSTTQLGNVTAKNTTTAVTITIAAPGVFSATAHGFAVGDSLYLVTTGALPTGLVANTTYYVSQTSFTTSTFTLASTRGGAYGGTAITTTGTQSGTQIAVGSGLQIVGGNVTGAPGGVVLAGSIGEDFARTLTTRSSPVALTAGTAATIVTQVLPPGKWVVFPFLSFTGSYTTTGAPYFKGQLSTTALGTFAANDYADTASWGPGYTGITTSASDLNLPVPVGIFAVPAGASTNVYLAASANFGGGTCSAYGSLKPVRIG